MKAKPTGARVLSVTRVRKLISLNLCFDSAWARLNNMFINLRHSVCLWVSGRRNGIVKMFRLTVFGIKRKV